MKKIFDYTAQELFHLLNETAENKQIEAKGIDDIHTHDRSGKRGKETFRSLMESICSFSNEPDLGGGVILLGIGENRDVCLNRYVVEDIGDLDKAQCDIVTQCKTLFNIPVYPDISIDQVAGHNVLKICVPELSASRKPLYFKQPGLPAGAYRRSGSSDLSCTDEDLYVFYQDSNSFDGTPIRGALVKDVDPDALKRYRMLRAKVNPSAEELNYNDQELLEALGCVSIDNPEQLTLAGVLLFGSEKLQRRVIPMVRIDYIRVPGNEWVQDPDASFRTMDMRGPLLLQVFRAVNAVNDDLPKEFHLPEGHIQAESRGLPVNALREAIVNAMMHRSYRVDRPTQIIRYDNRIEIINAGYSLKDEGKYNRPGSEIRNKYIAPVFHDTNLAETKGSGIKRMRELMVKAHLALPTFESDRDGNSFTVRFLLHHFLGEDDLRWLEQFSAFSLNDQQKTALIFLRETGALDNLTYRQMNNCDTLKASKELRAMRDMQLLEDCGKGSATYYRPGERMRKFMLQTTVSIPLVAESTIQIKMGDLHKNTAGLAYQEPELSLPSSTNTHSTDVIYQDPGFTCRLLSQKTPVVYQEPGLTYQEQLQNHSVTYQEPGVTYQERGEDDPNTQKNILLEKFPKELRDRLCSLKKREKNESILRELIYDMCAIMPLSKEQIALCLNRSPVYLRTVFLGPMIEEKIIRYSHPEVPTYRRQTYIANPKEERHE